MKISVFQESFLQAIHEQQNEIEAYHPAALLTLFFRAFLLAYLNQNYKKNHRTTVSNQAIFEQMSNPALGYHFKSILEEVSAQSHTPTLEKMPSNVIETHIPYNWNDDGLSTLREGLSFLLQAQKIMDILLDNIPAEKQEGIIHAIDRLGDHFSEFSWVKEWVKQVQGTSQQNESLALMALPPAQLFSNPSISLTTQQQAFVQAIKIWHLGEVTKVENRLSRWRWAARIFILLLIFAIGIAIISALFGLQSSITAQTNAYMAATNAVLAGEVAKIAGTDVGIASTAKIESTISIATARVAATKVVNFEANQIAAQALANNKDNNELALLLSIEAFHLLETAQTRSALFTILNANHYVYRTLHGHYGGVNDVVFHPIKNIIASAAADNQILLWDLSQEKYSFVSLKGNGDTVNSLVFSMDGKILASGSKDGSIQLWDVDTHQPIGEPLLGHSGSVTHVAINLAGQVLASAGEDRTIRFWDVQTGKQIGSSKTSHINNITSLAFSPDGQYLVSSGSDNNVFVWQVKNSGLYGKIFTNPIGLIWDLAFTPDGKLLAAATNAGTIHFWDMKRWKSVNKPLSLGQPKNILALGFNPEGNLLAAAGDEGLSLWEIATDAAGNVNGSEINRILFDPYVPITHFSFNANGKTLAIGSPSEARVPLLNVSSLIKQGVDGGQLLKGHQETVSTLTFNPTNKLQLASGSWDKTIRLWETTEELTPQVDIIAKSVLSGHSGYVMRLSYSPNGETLASASTDNTIRLWDSSSGAEKKQLVGHTQWVRSITFDTSGETLYSGGWDKSIRLWDVKSGKAIGEPLQNFPEAFYDFLFYSLNGNSSLFASSEGNNASIYKWNIVNGRQIDLKSQFKFGPVKAVYSMAMDSTNKRIAAGGVEKSITLWNIENGQLIGTPLSAHSGDILSLAFSPDGKFLASAGSDTKIIIWDMETRLPLGAPLEGHTDFVYSLAYRQDGKVLASGGADSKIILWDVDARTWVTRACQKAGRNLSQEEWGIFLKDTPYRKTCEINP